MKHLWKSLQLHQVCWKFMLTWVKHQNFMVVLFFFWRQEFSFPQILMTHPSSTHLSYPLKLLLQRIKKSFLHHFFSLQFTRAPLLSGRNNVSFSTGIDYKFLPCAELTLASSGSLSQLCLILILPWLIYCNTIPYILIIVENLY